MSKINFYTKLDGDRIVRESSVGVKLKYPWREIQVGDYFSVSGLPKGYYPKQPDSLAKLGLRFSSTSVVKDGENLVMVQRVA